MEVLLLTPSDYSLLNELLDVYEEAFELAGYVKPSSVYLDQLLRHPAMQFWVATQERKVIGGLTALILPSVYFPAAEVYIYDLAVKIDHQRQGVGTLLLQELKSHCKKAGVREIFVQADKPDKHAIDFYLKNGGVPEDVIHFSFPL